MYTSLAFETGDSCSPFPGPTQSGLPLTSNNSRKQIDMCEVYEITNIAAGETKKEIKTYPCNSPPQDVTKCPNYKFHAAGTSRNQAGPLQAWAKKDRDSSDMASGEG